MAGKRRFEEEEVLERALDVFWRRGFSGTTVDDLVHATGLGRGSLYGAFGNKSQLFVRVIDYYRAMVGDLLAPPTELDPGEALETIFHRIIEMNTSPDCPAGCLLTNTCTEFGILPADVQEHVRAGLADLTGLFRSVLEVARRRGQIERDADVDGLASFFVGVHQAVAVLAAAGADRDILSGVVRVSLKVWPDDRRSG